MTLNFELYRTMEVPESFAHRIEMFKENGYVWSDQANLFRAHSWIQVMFGQGLFKTLTRCQQNLTYCIFESGAC